MSHVPPSDLGSFCQRCIEIICEMADGALGKCPKCRKVVQVVNGQVVVAVPRRGKCRVCNQDNKAIVEAGKCDACLFGSRYVPMWQTPPTKVRSEQPEQASHVPEDARGSSQGRPPSANWPGGDRQAGQEGLVFRVGTCWATNATGATARSASRIRCGGIARHLTPSRRPRGPVTSAAATTRTGASYRPTYRACRRRIAPSRGARTSGFGRCASAGRARPARLCVAAGIVMLGPGVSWCEWGVRCVCLHILQMAPIDLIAYRGM